MNSKSSHTLRNIFRPYVFHPYVFVLKEGQKIKKDFLDYSLMILYTHSWETIQSPENHIPEPTEKDMNFFDLPF